MKIVNNEQDACNQVEESANDEHNELLSVANSSLNHVRNTNPGHWLVTFVVVCIVFIVVPILPILVAFGCGHYANYWLDKHK